jgi:hypothetical protein
MRACMRACMRRVSVIRAQYTITSMTGFASKTRCRVCRVVVGFYKRFIGIQLLYIILFF